MRNASVTDHDIQPPGIGLDIAVGLALAVVTGVLVWLLSMPMRFTLTHLDVWFDTDSLFIYEVMTDRWSDHHDRNNLHPIFGLITFPLAFAQRRLLGIDNYTAALVLLIAMGSAWTASLYATLRLMKRPIAAAVTFTALAVATTGGVLFLGIFERHIAGSVTILLCVAAFVAYERGMISGKWLTVAAAGTLGVTITNFMVGVAALFLAFGYRKGLQASINAFFAITMVSVIPLFLFPKSPAFLNFRDLPFSSTLMDIAGTPAQKTAAFWLHAVVLPKPIVETKPAPHEGTRHLSLQRAGIGNHGPIGYTTLGLWFVLLALGISQTYRRLPIEKVDILLGSGVLGHFLLFLFFGSETVLYAPSYVPLILLIVSRVLTSSGKRAAFVISLAFLGLLAWNNIQQFLLSVAAARSLL